MSTIRAKRYAHPKIAIPKQNEEIKQLKERKGQILPAMKSKQSQLKVGRLEPWQKLSGMSAWLFDIPYVDNSHKSKSKVVKAPPKVDNAALLKVMNGKIRERNLRKKVN